MLSLGFRAAVSHYDYMHVNIPLLFKKVDTISGHVNGIF